MPDFVVLAGSADNRRRVKVARIAAYDDDARQFLVRFEVPLVADTPSSNTPPDEAAGDEVDGLPFEPIVRRPVKLATVRARPGQARFRFLTIKRYGERCAVCRVSAKQLLEAVHIVPFEAGGPDDPRNGLVLCRNHHRAFDEHLMGFEPSTLAVKTAADGVLKVDPFRVELGRGRAGSQGWRRGHALLQVEHTDLKHLGVCPADGALRWRWERYLGQRE